MAGPHRAVLPYYRQLVLSVAVKLEEKLPIVKCMGCSVQEATELAPANFDYLARCSKAWSDATYLDEIAGKFREKLTDQAKRDFNEKALGYSKKVLVAKHC